MKEKPDVLSDEQIKDLPAESLPFEGTQAEILEALMEYCRTVAQAQRDADVAYYEPILREIFEEGDKLITQLIASEFIPSEHAEYVKGRWQSLKDKFLKGAA